MSTNRSFYYIKLKENYFHQSNIKILEGQENGYIYSLILLKMYLQACNTEGCLMMTPSIPYDPNNVGYLAKVIGHDVDHVKEAIRWCLKLDLITVFDSGQMWLTDMEKMIGKSSTEAERIAAYRRRLKKAELKAPKNSNNDDKKDLSTGVYKCTPETETEIEIETTTDSPVAGDISQEGEQVEDDYIQSFINTINDNLHLTGKDKLGRQDIIEKGVMNAFLLLREDEKLTDIAAFLANEARQHASKNKAGYVVGRLKQKPEHMIKAFREANKPDPPITTTNKTISQEWEEEKTGKTPEQLRQEEELANEAFNEMLRRRKEEN